MTRSQRIDFDSNKPTRSTAHPNNTSAIPPLKSNTNCKPPTKRRLTSTRSPRSIHAQTRRRAIRTRAGASLNLVAAILYWSADQACLRFTEKGGKSREIPVRHDLQQFIVAYIESAGCDFAEKSSPLFRAAARRTRRLTQAGLSAGDINRMVKRRLRNAGLPDHLSPHSFRVTTITDLLSQGVPLEDVQHLAGHADPRTTRLYDRRQKRVTRNIVERISI